MYGNQECRDNFIRFYNTKHNNLIKRYPTLKKNYCQIYILFGYKHLYKDYKCHSISQFIFFKFSLLFICKSA